MLNLQCELVEQGLESNECSFKCKSHIAGVICVYINLHTAENLKGHEPNN